MEPPSFDKDVFIQKIQELSEEELMLEVEKYTEEAPETKIIVEEFIRRERESLKDFDKDKYTEEVKEMGVGDLVGEIQVYINREHAGYKLIPAEKEKMEVLFNEYKRRGLDPEYFVCGAGAPGNCVIS